MNPNLIEVSNLECRYPESENLPPAICNINFTVQKGDFLVVSGPNGSGKTTLLNCISGLIPTHINATVSGNVWVQSDPIEQTEKSDLARSLGVVLDDPDAQIFGSSVLHYLAFGLELLGCPRTTILSRIDEAADWMGVSHLLKRDCKTLSGGEKQRVVVTSMLVMRPIIMVLDEPSSQLDPEGTKELFAALQHLNREFGMTIIAASQNVSELSNCGSHLMVLDKGQIRAYGSFRETLSHELTDLIRYPQATEFYLACRKISLPKSAVNLLPMSVDEGISYTRNLLGSNHLS